LSKFVEAENIEDLKKTFAAVSVDINNSEIVPVAKGNLRQAVLASIAIPVIFAPVIFEGRLLVDGGMLEPIPVQAARSLGADFVVAVDLYADSSTQEVGGGIQNESREPGTSTALDYLHSISEKVSLGEWFGSGGKDKKLKPNIIDIVERSLIVYQRYLTKYRLGEYPPDFIIRPGIPQLGLLDFHRARTIIEVGEKATIEALPKLIEEINNVSSG
jgi:Predicted esterase of the alpha-beta hydrolase superfamily